MSEIQYVDSSSATASLVANQPYESVNLQSLSDWPCSANASPKSQLDCTSGIRADCHSLPLLIGDDMHQSAAVQIAISLRLTACSLLHLLAPATILNWSLATGEKHEEDSSFNSFAPQSYAQTVVSTQRAIQRVQGVQCRRENVSLTSIPNWGAGHSCMHYSTVPEPKVNQGGIVPIPLAQTGEGIADCELLRWYVQEGDAVDEFQPLCEVQSDKASVEITSRYKGKVTRLLYIPGDIIKVGETLLELMVEEDHESSTATVAKDEKAGTEPVSQVSSHPADLVQKQKETLATPAVRNLANCYGIDLAAVSGTGKDGRILKEDVIRFALYKEELNEEVRGLTQESRGTEGTVLQSSPESSSSSSDSESDEVHEEDQFSTTSAKSPVEDHTKGDHIIPVRGFRRVMAKTMAAAVSIPHFHYTEEVEMNSIVQLKNSLKDVPSENGIKVTYLPFLIKALSLALLKYPVMNSTVNEDVSEIHVHASHNIGVGIASTSGLVVPKIKNVQRLSIMEIAEELARITRLAEGGKLSTEDVTGGTITVSNFGSIGGKYGAPILNVPEVAIVAIGRIQRLPRYNKDGILYPASIMGVTWGADHRVIDGATVARFCNEWKSLIEQPGRLLLNIK
ncbi:hypothetical protein R1sor_018874 [Riccia sorocarpa]|uniref:Dihydrolipoamide acetyltransferase component of pyruvate dehydrogenase complex n=1 Tax=Riccia sorocarpa TaxID=122646 RepID=A0ABD3IDP5_9MARC